ncbi:MAG TPA: extracellular solute-binding protein, partial [Thermoanaerobaculia bacterium]|nr:extracellular solute-binding protein [Thermoanaerobaculia bacterium]
MQARRVFHFVGLSLLYASLIGCGGRVEKGKRVIRYSGSSVGAEGRVLKRQIGRFETLHPNITVELQPTPDAADQSHQLYVEWLNSGSGRPDVLQLDVVWTPELAAAGWIQPVPRGVTEGESFLPEALAANRWRERLYGVPLFVDVGMLYWRTDLLANPPTTYAELETMAKKALSQREVRYGMVWQGARYEGLVTVFLEHAIGFGGGILAPDGSLAVNSQGSRRALAFMRREIDTGIVPRSALGWHEEQTRFAFQNGDALFMRNWPYAYPLMEDGARSAVAGRFAVAPMPAGPGERTVAALGGAELAVNAHSRHPGAAWALVRFLTQPAQLVERAKIAGEYPPLPALYRSGRLEGLLPIAPQRALGIISHATARPATPVYAQLSSDLQVELHRALSGQSGTDEALASAAVAMRATLARVHQKAKRAGPASSLLLAALGSIALLVLFLLYARRMRSRDAGPGPGSRVPRREERLGWLLSLPAIGVVAGVALFPLGWTFWESLHAHDLRMPWKGEPFVGLEQYASIAASGRFWSAMAHTAVFTVV